MTLVRTTDGKEKAIHLNELSELLVYDSPDSAGRYAKQALVLSQENDYPEGISNAHTILGNIYYLQGNVDSALIMHRQALSLRKQLDDKSLLADSYNNIGTVHDRSGDADSALAYYEKALMLFEKLKNNEGISMTLNNIGVFYYRQGNIDKAIENIERSEEIDREMGNLEGLGYTYSNLGAFYAEKKDFETSLDYHNKALKIRQDLKSPLQIARSLHNLGNVYQSKNDLLNADKYLRDALVMKRELKHPFEISRTLASLADVNLLLKNYPQAVDFAEEAYSIADSMGSIHEKENTLGILAKTHFAMGDYRSAYQYFEERYRTLREVNRQDKNAQVAEMMARYEAAKKEKEITRLNLEKNQADLEATKFRQRNSLLIAGFLLLLIVAASLYFVATVRARSNRELSRLNHELEASNHEIAAKSEEISKQKKKLEEQNEQISNINHKLELLVAERTADLRQTNIELDTFLYQSSHAMRAPVLRLVGLFELVENEQDPKTRQELADSITFTLNRTDGMLRKLNQVSGLGRKDARPAPIDLEHSVQEAMEEILCNGKDPGSSKVDIDQKTAFMANPQLFRIILTNLLENCCVFRKSAPGHITEVSITLSKDNGHTLLSVRDNGIGIPEKVQSHIFEMFYRGSERSKGDGLGLYVVKKLMEKMGATAMVTSVEGEFTEVVIAFPDQMMSHSGL